MNQSEASFENYSGTVDQAWSSRDVQCLACALVAMAATPRKEDKQLPIAHFASFVTLGVLLDMKTFEDAGVLL